jgi:hypothetical protein
VASRDPLRAAGCARLYMRDDHLVVMVVRLGITSRAGNVALRLVLEPQGPGAVGFFTLIHDLLGPD